MNKIITVAIAAILLTTTLTFAVNERARGLLPKITETNKDAFKVMLKNYLSPVIHGYGIGFTNDTYVIAKWHITNVKTLSRNEISNTLQQALDENETDWSVIKERIRNQLEVNGTSIKKGRIKIDNTMYLLTNITTSDTSASADIREIVNWETCKQQNVSAETCENSGTKVGYIALTKKTRANVEVSNDPRVWAGTLNFNSTDYTFVTFAYPR